MEEKDFIKYNITSHALERYAERMAGKLNTTDMRIYIMDYRDDIIERINKLINYGELIFEGKIKDHTLNQYYYKDKWVVIVDPKTKNVITLYKIDLGDDEVNDLFTNKMLEKIKEKQEELKDIAEKSVSSQVEYQEIIDTNNADIAYYRKMIKQLEEVNSSYMTLIKNTNIEVDKKKKEIADIVETLISGRKF